MNLSPPTATFEECCQILTAMIRASPLDYVDGEGNLLADPDTISRDGLVEITATPGKGVKVKTYDKLRAIQELGEMLGWKAGATAAGNPVVIEIAERTPTAANQPPTS